MKVKRFFLICSLIPLLAFGVHKFYVSTIRVEYKAKSETVQITMRIFTDDLQKVLNTTYDKQYQLDTPQESAQVDISINDYIHKNFKVTINAQETTYRYLGKEYDHDIVFLYAEIERIKSINSIEIKDSMLMEQFPDQKNIIKLYINSLRKTFLLTSKNNKEMLKFDE